MHSMQNNEIQRGVLPINIDDNKDDIDIRELSKIS